MASLSRVMKTVSCLQQGSKISLFCRLKQGQGLKALADHLHLNCPQVPPSPRISACPTVLLVNLAHVYGSRTFLL